VRIMLCQALLGSSSASLARMMLATTGDPDEGDDETYPAARCRSDYWDVHRADRLQQRDALVAQNALHPRWIVLWILPNFSIAVTGSAASRGLGNVWKFNAGVGRSIVERHTNAALRYTGMFAG
jgi:hypothetical protein